MGGNSVSERRQDTDPGGHYYNWSQAWMRNHMSSLRELHIGRRAAHLQQAFVDSASSTVERTVIDRPAGRHGVVLWRSTQRRSAMNVASLSRRVCGTAKLLSFCRSILEYMTTVLICHHVPAATNCFYWHCDIVRWHCSRMQRNIWSFSDFSYSNHRLHRVRKKVHFEGVWAIAIVDTCFGVTSLNLL